MITLKQAQVIVDHNDSFLTKIDEINGFKVQQFSYRLASFGDFNSPVPDSDIKAFELRGISFLEDGQRFLMLNKFFNLNETEGWMLDHVKDKKIIRVQDKLDGSMIRFIRLPDGSVKAKTKYAFFSPQAIEADKIYKSNINIKNVVDWSLDCGLAAIFELISPYNRIVLDYPETELRLLQLRDERDGKYIDIYDGIYYYVDKIKLSDKEPLVTWDKLLRMKEEVKDKEGWVITLEDGQMLKVKTDWYLSLHRLLTENVYQTNVIVEAILDEHIDDVISALPENFVEVRQNIQKLSQIVIHHFNHICDDVRLKIAEYTGDRKSFALKYKEQPYFGLYMLGIDGRNIEDSVTTWLKKQCFSLEKSERYIESIGGKPLRKNEDN
jgi:RNA ligase